jgi:hypothetical protein
MASKRTARSIRLSLLNKGTEVDALSAKFAGMRRAWEAPMPGESHGDESTAR